MDVSLEAVADQLGHASINVTKGVYVHLLPGSRAKAAKAMEELQYKDFVHVTTPRPEPVTRPLARHRLAKTIKSHPIRDSVGRPGLDPGTLGVFPEGPCKSITVQINWSDEVGDPSTYSEVLSELNSWLDSWLDQNKFIGTVDITFGE
jgi:hypothetical protein